MFEQGGTPVQYGESDDIDEKIGKRGIQINGVGKHHSFEHVFVSFFLIRCWYRFFFGTWEFGKTYGSWGIPEGDKESDRSGHSDSRWDPEAPFPGAYMVFTAHCTHDVSAEDDDQTGADRVGGIPHRHFRSQLFGGSSGSRVGHMGEAHTLQPAVCDPENTHKENQGIGKLGAIFVPL